MNHEQAIRAAAEEIVTRTKCNEYRGGPQRTIMAADAVAEIISRHLPVEGEQELNILTALEHQTYRTTPHSEHCPECKLALAVANELRSRLGVTNAIPPAESPAAPAWWCCDADYPNHAATCANAVESPPKEGEQEDDLEKTPDRLLDGL